MDSPENSTRGASDRTEGADKVSARIAALLSEYISIHRKLFADIYSHAGRIRDYNITKKEMGAEWCYRTLL